MVQAGSFTLRQTWIYAIPISFIIFTLFMTLKEKIAYYLLKNKYRRIKREVRISGIGNNRKVGVLWHITDREAFRHITEFLKDKPVIFRNLCYTGTPGEHLPGSFNKKDTNFLGFPKKSVIDRFMEFEYDLLFLISLTPCFPLEVVTALTKAHFKIGPSTGPLDYLDLSINTGDNTSSLYLVKQQIYYIEQFSKT